MHAWEKFLKEQEAEIGFETVHKWLRSLKIEKYDACNLYLEAKDSFQILWFEEHIRAKIENRLFNTNSKPIKVHLSAGAKKEKNKPEARFQKQEKKPAPSQFKLNFDGLDPHALIEHFIFSEDNELLGKVLKETNRDSHVFNPIYIYGSTGSGKTHLLMSLAASFQKQGLRTLYTRAESFTDHVVGAIRAGEMQMFREAYRNADVLLVDDVHIFSRKGTTQEEFFHTFNTLHINDKRIFLTANCAPNELQMIEPRLVSRFEWGIVLPLKRLNSKDLIEMLEKKCASFHFPLPQKILLFLVETFKSNPKSLVKALEALALRSHLGKTLPQSLTLSTVKALLTDLISVETKSAINFDKIIQTVSQYFSVPVEEILGKGQTKECALPRQIAMYICRRNLKSPYMKIGDYFGRDHSTVMTSVKQIEQAFESNHKEICSALYAVTKKLENLQETD